MPTPPCPALSHTMHRRHAFTKTAVLAFLLVAAKIASATSGKETDDCQLLTKTGLVTVHSQTASQCQQLCLRMSNCMGMMTFTKKGAMQPQVQSNTALPNQALCTPLGLEGRALETESRTCNDCFHRCRMMDKCSGLIFNNTLLFRYEMYTCETTKPWQRQPDDASYLLSEALLLPSRKLLRSDTLPS